VQRSAGDFASRAVVLSFVAGGRGWCADDRQLKPGAGITSDDVEHALDMARICPCALITSNE